MSQVLRQSTQIIVVIGPFVDVSDGFTPETGITLGAADEAELLKSNTTTTSDISAATWAAITGCDGWYGLTLTTTHTDTIGPLTVMVNDDSVCLPVFARFQVIEEAAYDTIYAASALPASTTNITAGTITTATNVTTVNGLAANVITATSINADAITAAKIADGAIDAATFAAGAITATVIATGAIDADALAADTITAAKVADDVSTEIANKVWDTDATGRQTQGTFGQAIGDPAADTNTIYKAVVTDATGATVGVDVVAVKADTAAILADTGTDGVALAAGSITSTKFAAGAIDAAAIAADAIGASEFSQAAAQEIADEVLNRNLAGGGSGNTRNVRNALRAIRNKVTDVGGTLTVTEEDDTTPAWTAAITRTAGQDPITGVDPA